MALTLAQYRFGVDSGTEATHGWHANQNTNPALGVIALDTTFLLRFGIQATGGVAHSNQDFQFQYSRNGGAFVDITTTSSVARAGASTALTEAAACTQRLTGLTGTFESSAAGQTEDGLCGGAACDIVSNGQTEIECGLQLRSADVVAGDVITFRVTRPAGDGGVLDTYSVVPSITVAGTRQITGSSAGTSTAAAILLAFGAITGSAAGTSTATGDLTEAVGSGAITGSAAGTSTATATLTARGALSGAAAGTCTAAAVLTADGALAGSAAGTSTATGTLTARGALAGSAAGTSSATGSLTEAGSVGAITGSAAGTSTCTATLTASGALAGSAAGTSTATATLTARGSLAGASAGTCTAAAALTADGALAGSAAGTSSASGDLTVQGAAPPLGVSCRNCLLFSS